MPSGVLREFSRRRVEIEERARELTGFAASELSRERMQGIALATRKAKEYAVDGARWQQEARARAAEHGLGPAEIRDLEARPARNGGRSVADVVAGAAARLSGPEGLTGQHNTFAGRHALAEIAGEFVQGATATDLQEATSDYLEHDAVLALGRIDAEHRFTTRGLLACERAIVDSAERRTVERVGMVRPRLAELVLAREPGQLTDEQAATVRALAADGQGVSVLQALVGTGKTRVLATLARVYETAGYRVVGVAPTGRAARELADTAHISALTIQRLVADLQGSGFASRTVVLFDEAGTAPTRPSAALFTAAERDGVKIIAVGDSGQLPSVAAGGWFAALAQTLRGPQLRQVMRQHDPSERDALAQLHDGDPDPYLELKHERGDLQVHDEQADAITATLAQWDQARRKHGISQAVMIARDNATRTVLNEHARKLLAQVGQLAGPGAEIADQEFRIGDRVIARRNDRYRDIDNGTLATITQIDHHTATLGLTTDAGHQRVLDASYAAEHLQHAYALTGHGAQGATVTSAIVIGRPSEFTREWACTALTRARLQTSLHVIAEQTIAQRDREQYAPPQSQPTRAEALDTVSRAVRRSEAEPLALAQNQTAELLAHDRTSNARLPLAELPEAGAERAAHHDLHHFTATPEPNWRQKARDRDNSRDHSHANER